MRRLQRSTLGAETAAFLRKRTAQVTSAAHPVEEAARLWPLQQNKAFAEIRRTLAAMASGRERCMYCEDSAGTDIDHFWPKSRYPEKTFAWLNHLLACSTCNRRKLARFPVDAVGSPLLVDPTAEEPLDHIKPTWA
jgi:uncharacterized protein (TIGR02646 family)